MKTQTPLPGMENALREQKQAADLFAANRLTEHMNRPPESIEEAAGEMERSSPLFRNSEANGQKALL